LDTTLAAINAGTITSDRESEFLQLTTYYNTQSQLSSWVLYKPPSCLLSSKTEVSALEMSTLQGARLLVAILLPRSQSFGRIAILNFANTINPGGDILSGGSDQEESIVRSSTLHPYLSSDQTMTLYSTLCIIRIIIMASMIMQCYSHHQSSFHAMMLVLGVTI
jgi:uncharacterized protein (TIGR02452 family)